MRASAETAPSNRACWWNEAVQVCQEAIVETPEGIKANKLDSEFLQCWEAGQEENAESRKGSRCTNAAGNNCETFFEASGKPACLPSSSSFSNAAEVAELLTRFDEYECYNEVTNAPQQGINNGNHVPCRMEEPCCQTRQRWYQALGCEECAEIANRLALNQGCSGKITDIQGCKSVGRGPHFTETETFRNCTETQPHRTASSSSEPTIQRFAGLALAVAAGLSALIV